LRHVALAHQQGRGLVLGAEQPGVLPRQRRGGALLLAVVQPQAVVPENHLVARVAAPLDRLPARGQQLGRASCRESVCPAVSTSVVAVSFTTNPTPPTHP